MLNYCTNDNKAVNVVRQNNQMQNIQTQYLFM